MRTHELIRLLKSIDPDEEEEVCVNNTSIISVEKVTASRNGPLEILYHDDDEYLFGGISKAEYRGVGHKIVLHVFSIEDAVLNNPSLPVYFPDEPPDSELIKKIDHSRGKALRVQNVPTFITKMSEVSLPPPEVSDFHTKDGWLSKVFKRK